jgi:hypothetical protein
MTERGTMKKRALLVVLTVWALLMIVPDLVRVVRPLSAFGFYANNNGLIYDVTGPFNDEQQSPAWRAGIRPGDQLDLTRMRCFPYDGKICASTIASVGGNLYVTPARTATLYFAATDDRPARQVTLVAKQRPANWLIRGILFLDQIAGIAAVLASAWLVWTRPGPMSWGFFLYVIWFNPGQGFEFYAQLQRWPLLLLAQDVLGCLSQAAGYAGLLVFVMRAPTGVLQPEWARIERALVPITIIIAAEQMGSYASAFGFGTEILTRATILFGLVVSLAAVLILILRRKSLSPKDNQRLRWVMWGSLIGLPAFVIADLSEYTTVFSSSWGIELPEDVAYLLYLVNGILVLFVFEALRRPRVVNVAIPLRRVTILALMMSVPAVLLHHEAERIQEFFDVPKSAWLVVGALVVFLIGRLHEGAAELADDFFNRDLDKAERQLGKEIVHAKDLAAVDGLLADDVARVLKLSSATTFRNTEAGFRRLENGPGWDTAATRELELGDEDIAALLKGAPRKLCDATAERAGFPPTVEIPVLAVPAASRAYCYAITLYGPHISGTAIDRYEHDALLSLGRHAADAYARLENDELRKTIATLQMQIAERGALA